MDSYICDCDSWWKSKFSPLKFLLNIAGGQVETNQCSLLCNLNVHTRHNATSKHHILLELDWFGFVTLQLGQNIILKSDFFLHFPSLFGVRRVLWGAACKECSLALLGSSLHCTVWSNWNKMQKSTNIYRYGVKGDRSPVWVQYDYKSTAVELPVPAAAVPAGGTQRWGFHSFTFPGGEGGEDSQSQPRPPRPHHCPAPCHHTRVKTAIQSRNIL